MKKNYALYLLVTLCIAGNSLLAQTTVVFTDNFDRSSFTDGSLGGTPPTTYNFTTGSTSSISTSFVSGTNYVANINSGSAANRALFVASLGGYSSPFNPILAANPGIITWTLNMRTNTAVTTTTLVNGSMAGGVDLCGNAGANIYSGTPSGYAVVFNSTGTGGVALVKFSSGLNANTVLITQTTSVSKTDYYSVMVTYDPSSNLWSLYVRDDGSAAFADPATGSFTLQGTATDATYVSQTMTNFGAVYTWTATAGKTMTVDNYSVSVTIVPCGGMPSAAISASAATGCGFYTSSLSLTGVFGSGITYQWQSSPDNSTWTTIPGGTNSSYVAGVTANVYYQCLVTCTNSGLTQTTSSVSLTISSPASVATLPFAESFETAWVSRCDISETPNNFWANAIVTGNRSWRREDDPPGANTASWGTPTTGSYSPTASAGSHSARFHSSQVAAGNTGALSLFVNMGTPGTKQISYSYINPSGTDVIFCQLSTDGGSTFTTLDAPPAIATTWTTRTLTTTAASAAAIIRFATISDQGSDDIGLDNVNVIQLCTTPVISGPSVVCIGTPATLVGTPTGGTWTSATTGVATINTTTGAVSALTTGTTVITANNGAGCVSSITLTVNPAVSAITGPASVCQGATIPLNDADGGGVWSSSNTTFATVGLTGIVTGAGAGVPSILYTKSAGCIATYPVTVNPLPSGGTITGTLSVCEGGATTPLGDASPGGVWSSLVTPVATVGTGGIVTGVAVGTALISYTVTNGCGVAAATAIVTVNPLPTPPNLITGTQSVCAGGGATLLADLTTGGVWSSTAISVATVGTSGSVTGVSAGTATISYTVSNSCGNVAATAVVTVDPLPAIPALIGGPTAVCEGGAAILLTNATPGGTWSSTNTAAASVDAAGTVTGVASGSTIISYIIATPSCGTNSTGATITVNPLPAAPGIIEGTAFVCAGGATTAFSDATAGGAWSSGSTGIATVDGTGTVTGVTAGNAIISYTSTNGCGNTSATIEVTVNPLAPVPDLIAGVVIVCEGGATTSLSDIIPGGTWSSTNTDAATIDASGVVTGVSTGTTTISYIITNSCSTTSISAIITVNPLATAPEAITGTAVVCEGGATTTLSDATSGGAWSSGSTSTATVNAGGIVTGVTAGTVMVSYTVTNSCNSASATAIVTVNPLASAPGVITGTAMVCEAGATTALADATTDGVWSSDNTANATVDPAGLVTGVSAGNATISYTVTNSCSSASAIALLTVNPLPTAGIITGTFTVCASGGGTLLDDAITGGAWSSDNISAATVSSAGLVTGVAAGIAVISYTATNICGSATTTATVTVNPLPPVPASITGVTTICSGASKLLSDATPGGTWSSTDILIATASPAGLITGVDVGTATISYIISTSCGTTYTSTDVNVISGPDAITGTANVCVGSTTVLGESAGGGTWSSNNGSLATVDAAGVVTGVAASGVPTISYTAITGCIVTARVTVNPLPAVITGTGVVCGGGITTLENADAGGTWSSSDPGIANTSPGGPGIGIITGVSFGNPIVTYTLPTGCLATSVITVNPTPFPVDGNRNVCLGITMTLSDFLTGGAWSSSDAAVASVDMLLGIVSGISAGTAVVTYTMPETGCFTTAPVIFQVIPDGITGAADVCAGATITLSDPAVGGTWSSSDAALATILPDGTVHGVSAGSPTITYTIGTGCTATTTINVNPLPAPPDPISGTLTLCESTAAFLTDDTPDGTWSSSNTTVASAGESTGLIIGLSPGSATISYTVTNGCGSTSVFSAMTINPLPATPEPITGVTGICEARSALLADITYGGDWASDNAAVASISTDGLVTGLSAGIATISYTKSNSCGTSSVTTVVTVNPLPVTPAAITGTATVCEGGASTTLSDATPGGTWSSSNLVAATVSAGEVTGLVSGAAIISYTMANGCGSVSATTMVTVNPLPVTPALIRGTAAVCPGNAVGLHDATPGGMWSSSNLSVATIDPTGIVTGVTTGTTTVSYTESNSCGSATATFAITVNPVPVLDNITGTPTVCLGSVTLLHNTAPGGIWISGNNLVAIVSPLGVVTGVASGTSTITYVATNSCGGSSETTVTVTINQLPSAGVIGGKDKVCIGDTIILSNIAIGGIWSIGNTLVGTITGGGVLKGLSAGLAVVTYTHTNDCGTLSTTQPVTVNDCNLSAGTVAGNDPAVLTAYPNPSNASFTLLLSSGVTEQMHVVITNMIGQRVREFTAQTNRSVDIRLETAAGTYFISVNTEHGSYNVKMIVQ